MQVSGDLTIGVKSVTIVSVPSGTFLTPAQIDGVSPPIAGPVATAAVEDGAERRRDAHVAGNGADAMDAE